MALTEEEIALQIDVLTKKTSDNPEMIYKASATLNKALNPNYFSGQNTKIVNAINKLAADFEILEKFVRSTAGKNDDVLLDVHTDLNAPVWEETQELMEATTVIEGINLILKGHHLHKMLNITVEDINKVLTVGMDEKGKLITKAISLGDLGHTADTVKYENEALPEIHTVEDAINHILSEINKPPLDINWDMIQNKPAIGNALELSEGVLEMKSGDEVISTINITIDSDIDDIISSLE
jgi:hypothetical protein